MRQRARDPARRGRTILPRELATVEIRNQASRIQRECAGNLKELDHVQAALAALEFRDEGLGTAELVGEGNLGEPRVSARAVNW